MRSLASNRSRRTRRVGIPRITRQRIYTFRAIKSIGMCAPGAETRFVLQVRQYQCEYRTLSEMSMHNINGIKIRTEHVYPPIPARTMDWSAVTDDYDAGHPIGWGRTEQDAITDLMEQLSDE